MAEVHLTWIEKQRFRGVDSAGHSVVLAPPNDAGVTPTEMLLVALAACAAHDVVVILQKQRAGLQRLSVAVTGEQAGKPPRAFQRIHLRFHAVAPNARASQFDRAVDLALNKYCSVRASLSAEIAVTFEAILEAPPVP